MGLGSLPHKRERKPISVRLQPATKFSRALLIISSNTGGGHHTSAGGRDSQLRIRCRSTYNQGDSMATFHPLLLFKYIFSIMFLFCPIAPTHSHPRQKNVLQNMPHTFLSYPPPAFHPIPSSLLRTHQADSKEALRSSAADPPPPPPPRTPRRSAAAAADEAPPPPPPPPPR